jgi:hypothetical protein
MDSFSITYKGKDTDKHVIDVLTYGESISGTGKLYVSVAHFCNHGEVLKPRQTSDIKCYVGTPKPGSYETVLFLATSLTQIPLFSDFYKIQLDWLIGTISEFIKDKLTGRGNVDKLIEAVTERAKGSEELNHILVNGLLKSNQDHSDLSKAILEKMPNLVAANTGNLKRAVAPVGRTCNEMSHFSGMECEFQITEPDAEAIRSKEDLEVDDLKDYECSLISELNTKTGHCHLHLVGDDKHVIGKINDPALLVPNNIYSESLNAQNGFKFNAKAVLKDGEIHRLYVSDAFR